MRAFFDFLNNYRIFRTTPIVDDEFPINRDIADCSYEKLVFDLHDLKNVEVVCLCGSTKFKAEFEQKTRELTLNGMIVLSVGCFMHADSVPITDEQKLKLDELHKRKIDLCDTVFVINKDGYIGSSTRSEIEYAKVKGKAIIYLE